MNSISLAPLFVKKLLELFMRYEFFVSIENGDVKVCILVTSVKWNTALADSQSSNETKLTELREGSWRWDSWLGGLQRLILMLAMVTLDSSSDCYSP